MRSMDYVYWFGLCKQKRSDLLHVTNIKGDLTIHFNDQTNPNNNEQS